jgi:hypothetical protein
MCIDNQRFKNWLIPFQTLSEPLTGHKMTKNALFSVKSALKKRVFKPFLSESHKKLVFLIEKSNGK